MATASEERKKFVPPGRIELHFIASHVIGQPRNMRQTVQPVLPPHTLIVADRKSTRLNSSHT